MKQGLFIFERGCDVHMKKLLLCMLGILCAIAIIFGYHFSYPIHADQGNLKASMDQWLNRGNRVGYTYNIKMYPSIILGKLIYIPIELDENLGYVVLEKGITNRYKIARSSYGTGSFRNGIIDVNGEKQLLFMGRNTLGEISKVKITINKNHEYEIIVPKQGVFLAYTAVDNDIPTGPISLEKIALYNSQGQDVTLDFDLSGGSIQ